MRYPRRTNPYVIFQRAEKRRKRREKLDKSRKEKHNGDDTSENDENDPSTNWLKAGARRKRTVSSSLLIT